jgi:ABC-type glycerol-3-phosphate transport system substrate-binding protein
MDHRFASAGVPSRPPTVQRQRISGDGSGWRRSANRARLAVVAGGALLLTACTHTSTPGAGAGGTGAGADSTGRGSAGASAPGGGDSVAGGSASVAGDGSSAPVTITWATESSGPQLDAEKKVIAAFHAANPSVTVTVDAIPFDSYDTKLTTALRAGNGPDVFRVNHPNIQAWTNAEFLAPLTNAGVDAAPFIPGLVTAGQVGGVQYTLPMDTDARALYYNPRLLKKAGIDAPPTTWDQLLTDIVAVGRSGDYGYGFRNSGDYDMAYETIGPYMKTAGGQLLSPDGSQADAANSAGTVAAVELLQRIVKTGALPPGQSNMTENTLDQLFAKGKLAFMIAGPWERPTILKAYPKAVYDQDFATAPVPTRASGDKPASASGGWQIGMSATSKNPGAARALVAYFERTPNLLAVAAPGTFPPLTAGLQAEPWKSDPFYDAYKVVLPNSGLPIPPVPQLAQIAAALQTNVAPAVLNGSSAREALTAFDTQVNQQIRRR